MTQVTVKELAQVVDTPVERLLLQCVTQVCRTPVPNKL